MDGQMDDEWEDVREEERDREREREAGGKYFNFSISRMQVQKLRQV